MSRGPGHVEKTLRELFANNPTDAFTTEELVAAAYPGVNRIEKKHRVSVLRATRRIVETVPELASSAGGFARRALHHAADWQSFGLGRLLKTGTRVSSRRGETEFYQSKEAMRAKANSSPPQTWHRAVLIHRAQRDGDTDTAAALSAEQEAEGQAFLEASKKMLTNLRPRRRATMNIPPPGTSTVLGRPCIVAARLGRAILAGLGWQTAGNSVQERTVPTSSRPCFIYGRTARGQHGSPKPGMGSVVPVLAAVTTG